MRKLIHLTDLHVGDNDAGDRRFQTLVERLVAPGSPVSPQNAVILISGDFVERASVNSYNMVESGLSRLRAHGFDLTGCPGNHDLFNEAGDLRQANMALFNRHVFSCFTSSNAFQLISAPSYPLCHVVDGAWTLIVLNSEAEALDGGNLVKGKGRLGKAQLTALGALLDSNDIRGPVAIALHHNPFQGEWFNLLALTDNDEFFEVLRPRVHRIHAILFGHLHNRTNYRQTKRNQIPDWITPPLLLDGGVSANFTGQDRAESAIRLLNIDAGLIENENLLGLL